jgi:hypothetical protein
MEAVRTSETSVDNHFTRQCIPEDNSEHYTRRRENLMSHIIGFNLRKYKIAKAEHKKMCRAQEVVINRFTAQKTVGNHRSANSIKHVFSGRP